MAKTEEQQTRKKGLLNPDQFQVLSLIFNKLYKKMQQFLWVSLAAVIPLQNNT